MDSANVTHHTIKKQDDTLLRCELISIKLFLVSQI